MVDNIAQPVNFMRQLVSIPPGCRERYHALDHPALVSWHKAGVVFSGISDLVQGYRIVNPHPDSVMLILTAAGRGWAQVPGEHYDLTPGSLLICGPQLPVAWAASGPWRIAWWYLRPGSRWSRWNESRSSYRQCPTATLLADLADDLHARTGIASQQHVARSTALLLLSHLEACAEAHESQQLSADDRFARLWHEVERDPAESWSLPELARRLDCSVSSLQRMARRHLGVAPARALAALRLARARELLRRTDYPLGTVAELVGYGDAFSLSTAYRRWAGHPPSAERSGQAT